MNNSDKQQDNYIQNLLAPPGLQTFQMNEGEQKSVLNEYDNHFLQYVDKCKNQVSEQQPNKVKTKRKKKISQQIQKNNASFNSRAQDIDLNKTGSNFINVSDLLNDNSSKNSLNQNEIRNTNNQPQFKGDSKKKIRSLHLEQQQSQMKYDQNLVDKFLVAVIPPAKIRYSQIRNQDTYTNEYQQIEQGGSNTSQINELLSQQQQILKQQLNENHAQSINFTSSAKKPQGKLQINTQIMNDNNELQIQYQNNQQQFLNRLLSMRSQSSVAQRVYRRGKNEYFESMNKYTNKSNIQDQDELYEYNQNTLEKNILDQNIFDQSKLDQNNSANIKSKNKLIQNNQFSENHYSGNYSFNQIIFPTDKTMENLLIKEFMDKNNINIHDKNISKKMNEWKTEFQLKKQSQMKQIEDKYKQSMKIRKYPDVSLQIQQNDREQQKDLSYSNNLTPNHNGINLQNNKEDEYKLKLSKELFKYKDNNKAPPSMIYYNNLGQLSISDYSVNNKRRLKPSLSISPNNLNSVNNNESVTTKHNLQMNFDNNNFQKQEFNQNPGFQQLGKIQRTPTTCKTEIQCDNSNLNKSCDIPTNLNKKQHSEKRNISFDSKLIHQKTSNIPLIKNKNLNQNLNKSDNNLILNKNENIQIINNPNENFLKQNDDMQNSTINKTNYNQRNLIPSQTLYSPHNAQNQPVNKNLNTINNNQIKNTNQTQSPSFKIGNGCIYFQQQDNLNQQSATKPEQSKYINGELSENINYRQNLLQMETFKKSPQKGNSIKNNKQEKEMISQLLKNKGSKLNKSEIDRISYQNGISPSLLRKSLQVKDVIQNNIIYSAQAFREAINSLSNQKVKDNFSFVPVDSSVVLKTNEGQDENNNTQKINENEISIQNMKKCVTEGDNNEDTEESILQSNGRFKRYQHNKSQNQSDNLKISQLFRETIQKRSQQNQLTNKQLFQNMIHDNKYKTILKPINTESNTNQQKSTKDINNKASQQQQKQFSQNNQENQIESNQDQQNENNQSEKVEEQKERNIKQKSFKKDKNTRYIHLCVVKNTQEFVSFLQKNKYIFDDSSKFTINQISQSKPKSNTQSSQQFNNINNNSQEQSIQQAFQTDQQSTQQTDQQSTQLTDQSSISINYELFKNQINFEALQQSDSPSFYFKRISIPKQQHLIYMTEMSIKYAQNKLFFCNFHSLLQKLNAQENITTNEPYKYIFNSNLSLVSNIFEVNDNMPFLIITKQMLFPSKFNLIEDNLHLQVQTTPSPGKTNTQNHSGHNNGMSCNTSIIPQPNISFLNKSSILTKIENQPNPNLLLYTTTKNSIRDKMRAQTSLGNHKIIHKQYDKSPKAQQINPETLTKNLENNTVQIHLKNKTNQVKFSNENNQILELNQSFDKQDIQNQYMSFEINQKDQMSKDSINDNASIPENVESIQANQINLNKQIFDFDVLVQSHFQQIGQNNSIKQGIHCQQLSNNHSNNHSNGILINNPQQKNNITPKGLQQINSSISPQSAQYLPLSQQICNSTSNKTNADNIKYQKLNIMRLFLSKFNIPSQKYLQEQLNNDAFWNHGKNEIDQLFIDFLYMVQSYNGFLDKNHMELLEISNLRTKISRIFNEKLYISFQILQRQYPIVKKIKNDNIIRAIVIQTCIDNLDLPYQNINSACQVHIQWNQFLRFHALFIENKWNREEKIQFIENTINSEKEQTIMFEKMKQRIHDMFTNYSFCKKLINYFESNTCTSKEGQQVITQARFRELICKEQIISTQDIISQLLQQN